MSETPFATWHCLCGAVTYTIRGEPVGMGQCHCKDCQRASGIGHMSIARFKREDVMISGQTTSYARIWRELGSSQHGQYFGRLR